MSETKTKYKNGFGVMLAKCKDLKTLANVSQRTEILDFPLPFHIAVALTSDTDVRTAFKSPKTCLKKKKTPFWGSRNKTENYNSSCSNIK